MKFFEIEMDEILWSEAGGNAQTVSYCPFCLSDSKSLFFLSIPSLSRSLAPVLDLLISLRLLDPDSRGWKPSCHLRLSWK